MNPSMRKFVTGPDGRRWYGRWPQSMPDRGEGPFIAALAKLLDGACEVVLPVGRADAATNTTVFEVEPARSWRTGVRQVLGYAGQTGLQPALALFGPADYLKVFLFLRDRVPHVQLWVHRNGWERVTSRATARLVHRPEYDVPLRVGVAA